MQEQQTRQLYNYLNTFITEIENSDEAIFQFTSLSKEEFQLELTKLLRGLIKTNIDNAKSYFNSLSAEHVFNSVLFTIKEVYGEEAYQEVFSKITPENVETTHPADFIKEALNSLDKTDSVKWDNFIKQLKQKKDVFCK